MHGSGSAGIWMKFHRQLCNSMVLLVLVLLMLRRLRLL
jgi:hypothetical protein